MASCFSTQTFKWGRGLYLHLFRVVHIFLAQISINLCYENMQPFTFRTFPRTPAKSLHPEPSHVFQQSLCTDSEANTAMVFRTSVSQTRTILGSWDTQIKPSLKSQAEETDIK